LRRRFQQRAVHLAGIVGKDAQLDDLFGQLLRIVGVSPPATPNSTTKPCAYF